MPSTHARTAINTIQPKPAAGTVAADSAPTTPEKPGGFVE